MNHMSNDQIKKRVKSAKESFERVRKELRKLQDARAKAEIGARKKDHFEIVKKISNNSNQEMEDVQNREERALRENNRRLEDAKIVGLACDDMANDIKFNLSK